MIWPLRPCRDWWRGISIRMQLMLGMAASLALCVCLLAWQQLRTQSELLREQHLAQARDLAGALAVSAAPWVMADDLAGMQEVIASVAQASEVRYAMLVSLQGRVMAHSRREHVGSFLSDPPSLSLLAQAARVQTVVAGESFTDMAAPVMAGARQLGWARVGMGNETVQLGVERARSQALWVLLLALLLGSVVAVLIADGLTRGLQRLVDALDQVSQGQRGFRLSLPQRRNELGRLGAGFDGMLTALERGETESRQAAAALAQSEQRFRALFELAAVGVVQTDAQGRLVRVNQRCAQILGWSAQSLAGKPWRELAEPQDLARMEPQLQALLAGQIHEFEAEARFVRADGTMALLSLTVASMGPEGAPAQAIVTVLQDISSRRAAEEKLRQAASVFESTSEAIMLTDAQARIVAVNPAFTQITGYEEAEVLGRNPRLMQSGRQSPGFYRELWTSLIHTGRWHGEIWNRRKSGEIFPAWVTLSVVKNEAGEVTNYVSVLNDLSLMREAQQQLDYLSGHDALTSLPNRTVFREGLQQALERARRDGRVLAMIFVDLDRFKNVNDTLGHPLGDELLRSASQRLRALLPPATLLARLGGDEFGLVLDDDASVQGCLACAQRLLADFERAFHIGGHALVVTLSLGISLFPEDASDADTLVRHAERAMYEAKTKGRNAYQFFEPSLAAGVLERLMMETALRGAAGRGELLLHFQPQIDLHSGGLAGVEALVRWQHPQLGLVSPAQFIPLAEEVGLISEIGDWVLQQACAQMVAWEAQGLRVPRIAVNLSVQQIEDPQHMARVALALAQSGLAGDRLELEVTESLIMRQPEQAQRHLQELLSLGVEFAIDDFGTGHSSLAYLRRLPLHRLKIDQSFVRDIGEDSGGEAIVHAVIALARALGLHTVAEGVEQPHQAEFLRQAGCDTVQGYHFGRPMPAAQLLERWLDAPARALPDAAPAAPPAP
jgi:diguanylate cyclase (GGDEF)-like protein/PAS domain S-box-containing protein